MKTNRTQEKWTYAQVQNGCSLLDINKSSERLCCQFLIYWGPQSSKQNKGFSRIYSVQLISSGICILSKDRHTMVKILNIFIITNRLLDCSEAISPLASGPRNQFSVPTDQLAFYRNGFLHYMCLYIWVLPMTLRIATVICICFSVFSIVTDYLKLGNL